jgi:hypothetical protein
LPGTGRRDLPSLGHGPLPGLDAGPQAGRGVLGLRPGERRLRRPGGF